jgi:hypothetical protein
MTQPVTIRWLHVRGYGAAGELGLNAKVNGRVIESKCPVRSPWVRSVFKNRIQKRQSDRADHLGR